MCYSTTHLLFLSVILLHDLYLMSPTTTQSPHYHKYSIETLGPQHSIVHISSLWFRTEWLITCEPYASHPILMAKLYVLCPLLSLLGSFFVLSHQLLSIKVAASCVPFTASPYISPLPVLQKSSERHPQENLGLPGGGNSSSTEGRGRRDGSVESEKWSRKRGHDRDSRLVAGIAPALPWHSLQHYLDDLKDLQDLNTSCRVILGLAGGKDFS